MGNIISSIDRKFSVVNVNKLINLTIDEANIYILKNNVYSDNVKINEIREVHDYNELVCNIEEYSPSRLNVEVRNERIIKIINRG
jgi:hypothetical protein